MIVVEEKKRNKQEYILVFGILHGLNGNCMNKVQERRSDELLLYVVVCRCRLLVVDVVGCSFSFHDRSSFCYLSVMILYY